jgi:competence protein ComEC
MKLHHRPLFLFTSAYIIGIVFAIKSNLNSLVVLGIAILLLSAVLIRVKEMRLRLSIAILGCTFAVSLLRTLIFIAPPPDDVSKYAVGKKVHLTGVVVSDPTVRANRGIGFILDAERIRTYTGEYAAHGKVNVGILSPMDGSDIERCPMYGEVITVHGRLEIPPEPTNPGESSMRERLWYRGIHCMLSAPPSDVDFDRPAKWSLAWAASCFRAALREKASAIYPPSFGHLLTAVIIGDCTSLTNEVRDAFSRTGTAHIIVPSGYNLAVIAVLLGFLVGKTTLPRTWRHVLLIICLWAFVFVAGGGPSITRAAIMMTVVLSSYLVKRVADPVNALFLACILILIANPLDLYEDGFRLAFISVLSVLLSLPLMEWADEKVFGGRTRASGRMADAVVWCARIITASVAISIIVSIAVWPIVASSSNYFQLLSIPANALTALLVFAITVGGVASLLLGSISTVLAAVITAPTLFCLRLMLGMVLYLSSRPWCVVSIRTPSGFFVACYYLALLGIGEYVVRKTNASKKAVRAT